MIRTLLIFTLFIFTAPAFAGGLECQKTATCQCQHDGLCDELGNSITQKPLLVCGNPGSDFQVQFSQHFTEMPLMGSVPATFNKLPLTLHDSIETMVGPDSTRTISFTTAYCEYNIRIVTQEGQYFVLDSSRSCEGTLDTIQCEIH
ncbi:MAG: hypothetical protein H6623_07250 [Bdellovibrionaceae bacterium]|nr:hypothetical protein [Pseudobdellovibrionaceae bacterium]